MLIFEIPKTNTPQPQKGLAPILIDPPHIYVTYAIQATIILWNISRFSTEITWELFFPSNLLLSVFPSRSKYRED